jgi:subtilisin family serine protease
MDIFNFLLLNFGTINKVPTREYRKLYFDKFGVSEYHEIGIKGQGTSVYVIDTGLSAGPDSSPSVSSRRLFSSGKSNHGSFVSSILSQGLVPDSKIYVADIADKNGKIYTSALTKAVKDAIDLNVDIISISLGTNTFDKNLDLIVKKAVKQGILVFAASGNCGCRSYEYPSSIEEVISVASMDSKGRPSSFNTRNDAVSIFAPGENILVPGSKSRLSGTSFAVPFASGLAALELSRLRKYDSPTLKLSRSEMVPKLRGILGLNCELHSYNLDKCTGATNNPLPRDGLPWLFVLSLISVLILSILKAHISFTSF